MAKTYIRTKPDGVNSIITEITNPYLLKLITIKTGVNEIQIKKP